MYPFDPTTGSTQDFQNQVSKMLLPQAQQQMQRHVTKVNGRPGADSFNMPPDSDDILLDMNEPIIYFVQTDGAGYKTVTPYDISPHKEVSQTDILKDFDSRIKKLEEAMNNGKPNYRPNEQKPKSGNGNNDAGSRSNA